MKKTTAIALWIRPATYENWPSGTFFLWIPEYINKNKISINYCISFALSLLISIHPALSTPQFRLTVSSLTILTTAPTPAPTLHHHRTPPSPSWQPHLPPHPPFGFISSPPSPPPPLLPPSPPSSRLLSPSTTTQVTASTEDCPTALSTSWREFGLESFVRRDSPLER